MSKIACSLCFEHFEKERIRHLELYAFGSEGVWICHWCEMKLVDFCRLLSCASLRERREKHKETTKCRD